MANHEIPVLLSELKNQFSTDMREIETSDLVHADTVNPLFRQLLINDAYASTQMKDLAAGTTENDALQTEEKQMVNAVNEINRKLGDLTETVEGKVEKIEGKGLSSNDFTNEEKQKLSNLSAQSELDATLEQKINKTDIVNDLFSGGVEKVLSAEQGKVLFQSVVDGKGKIATAINDLAGSSVANQNMTFGDLTLGIRAMVKKRSVPMLTSLEKSSSYRRIRIRRYSSDIALPVVFEANRGIKVSRYDDGAQAAVIFNQPVTDGKFILVEWEAYSEQYAMMGVFFKHSKLPNDGALLPYNHQLSLNGDGVFRPHIKKSYYFWQILEIPKVPNSEDVYFGIGIYGYNGEKTEIAYIRRILVLNTENFSILD